MSAVRKEDVNPYAGFVWGRIYNDSVRTDNVLITNLSGKSKYKGEFLTPVVDVTPGHSIAWIFSATKYAKDVQASDWAENPYVTYDSNGNATGGWGRNHKATSTMSNTDVKARFAGVIDEIDDFYVYDVTDGVFLFKGKNVTTIPT